MTNYLNNLTHNDIAGLLICLIIFLFFMACFRYFQNKKGMSDTNYVQNFENFVDDIEMISLSIELEDKEMISDAIKAMAANCSTCHKKFRN